MNKIVRIQGGLGNQMFQYSFGLYLQKVGYLVKYDNTSYNNNQTHSGYELDRVFNLKLLFASEKEIFESYDIYPLLRYRRKINLIRNKYYFEKNSQRFRMSKKTKIRIDSKEYFDGYWQSVELVDEVMDKISRSFEFPKLNGVNKVTLDEILDCNSISLHLRRGDYLKYKAYTIPCSGDYYKNSIKYLASKYENPLFFVFTNDKNYAKSYIEDLKVGIRYKVVENNNSENSFKDMILMSKCKGMIIANSTFSWWGAYLNKNDDKIIVAPKDWKYNRFRNRFDIIPNNWIKI